MLDAADVDVYGKVGVCGGGVERSCLGSVVFEADGIAYSQSFVVRIGETCIVPRRINKGIHCIGIPFRGSTTAVFHQVSNLDATSISYSPWTDVV